MDQPNEMNRNRKAVVLHNTITASSPEDVIDSFTQAEWIAGLLGEMGYAARTLPYSDETLDYLIRQMRLDETLFAVNLVDAAPGETELAYTAAESLERLHIPFTGCSSEALRLTTDKVASKRVLRRRGIPTPEWVCTASDDDQFISGERYIMKMVLEDASAGLTDESVASADDLLQLRDWLKEREQLIGSPFFAERFIDGREFNVCICGSRENPLVLPPYEWKFEGYDELHKVKIISYDAKWTEHTFEFDHVVPCYHLPDSDAGLLESLQRAAGACWEEFALEGYARVDFRVDSDGNPWVLEINGNPSFYGFYHIARQYNLEFTGLLELIIEQIGED